MDGWIARSASALWLFASPPVRAGSGWTYEDGTSSSVRVPIEYAPSLTHADPPIKVRICAMSETLKIVNMKQFPVSAPWPHASLELLTELE